MSGLDIWRKKCILLSSAEVVHTTAKHVISRRGKNENGWDAKCTKTKTARTKLQKQRQLRPDAFLQSFLDYSKSFGLKMCIDYPGIKFGYLNIYIKSRARLLTVIKFFYWWRQPLRKMIMEKKACWCWVANFWIFYFTKRQIFAES